VLDSACGYAAYSLMPADAGVLTVEFKVNLLSPARGDRFLARGKVTRSGKTISVATGDLYASGKNGEKHVATMTATIMTITNSEGVRG
jgi:acyl-coenzyme A thioesterase PaaI-like protein